MLYDSYDPRLYEGTHSSFIGRKQGEMEMEEGAARTIVSHSMRGSLWLVQTIFFIDYSCREEKNSRVWVIF